MLEPLSKFINQVETFLQTRNSGNKDTNYMLAILDSRFANTTSSVIASKTTTTKIHKSFIKDIQLQYSRCHYLPRKNPTTNKSYILDVRVNIAKNEQHVFILNLRSANTKITFDTFGKMHSFSG